MRLSMATVLSWLRASCQVHEEFLRGTADEFALSSQGGHP